MTVQCFVQVESGFTLYTKAEALLGNVPLAFARDDYRVVNTRVPLGANPYYRMSDVSEAASTTADTSGTDADRARATAELLGKLKSDFHCQRTKKGKNLCVSVR